LEETTFNASFDFERLAAELEKSFGKLPDSFFDLGGASAERFEEGFSAALKGLSRSLRRSVENAMAAIVPELSFLARADGGGTTNIKNTFSYQFNSSGETVAQQLLAADADAQTKKHRGGLAV
jgi:hypothetical protein